ncbi:transcriptional regulator, SARP family [Rhizobium sp. CF080]|uniref:BTAD domain-containing putative transcriptional regulator n=1 Tax=Rhizobium sp. (strain CF080) TaxID=1144310 RepID=UPI0003E7F49B|nr:BTAD domain-containing putative transcriptional regulator [Rhizobium sp. CF080]EUB96619.1 transcriptional regulator, SARP family [Rhizobium sp. CF080]
MLENTMLQIRLLGRPSLQLDGVSISLPEKAYFLFAVVAMAPRLTVDRETIRRLLWPSHDPEKRANSLRQLLARIAKAVGPDAPAILVTDEEALRLACGRPDVDLLALMEPGPLREENWDLIQGELLEAVEAPTGGAEDWLSDARRKVGDSRSSHIESLLAIPAHQQSSSLPLLANRLIELDASHEGATRALMKYHVGHGDFAAARQAYGRCRDQLRADYDTPPTPETVQLAYELGILSRPGSDRAPAEERPKDVMPTQPRVVILPPETIVQDALVQRLGRALLEDVTIGLSHQRVFKIIAAHTSFELINRLSDPHQRQSALSDLQFDYSVFVTIQGEGDEIFATCRLTRVGTGEVLWAINLPLDVQHMSASFGQLARRISASLTDVIERHEIAKSLDDVDPSAYRLYLEGKRYLSGTDLQHLRQARKWFKSAVKRCDSFSPAHAGISRSLGMEWLVRGMKDHELLDVANQSARASRDLDPGSGRAFRELGFISLYRRRFDESLDLFQEAQNLNPSDADVLVDYSDALSHAGDLDKALDLGLAAFKLNPLPPDYYYWILGSTYYVRQEYSKAIDTIDPVRTKHATARLLAASHAMADDIPAARKYAAIVRENFPDFRSEDIRYFVPDRDPAHAELLIHGLRLAGLP